MFVTHTAADPDSSQGYDNAFYRRSQVAQMAEEQLATSDADVVILGGDINSPPDEGGKGNGCLWR